MSNQKQIDELSEQLRKLKAVYRIRISDDGADLAEIIHTRLANTVEDMIETIDTDHTQILKGKCQGMRDVLNVFESINEWIADVEAEIQSERDSD